MWLWVSVADMRIASAGISYSRWVTGRLTRIWNIPWFISVRSWFHGHSSPRNQQTRVCSISESGISIQEVLNGRASDQQALLRRVQHQLTDVLNTHLLHQAGLVRAHGLGRQVQFQCDVIDAAT